MGILSRLFGSTAPLPVMEHPLLGRLEAVIDHGDGRYFWEMPDEIETPIGPVCVSFDADEMGPSYLQIEKWRNIVENFGQYKRDMQPILRERMTDFAHETKIDQLKPTGFGFYSAESEDADWDVSFELASDGFLYTVCFKDGFPTIVHADS